MNKQKKRPPKTWKCSKSKTIRHRELKSSHHVDLIRSTWCDLFSFLGLIFLDLVHFKVLDDLFLVCSPFVFQLYTFVAKMNLRTCCCHKIWVYALFCRPESFVLKSLLSGKFSTFLPLHLTTVILANKFRQATC